jgi:putative addiction module component (TIGR02574 family)
MGPTMKALGIDRLTPEQQIVPALEIWESLGDDRPAGRLTAGQRAELARRDAELAADPGIALTWEQIRAGVEEAAPREPSSTEQLGALVPTSCPSRPLVSEHAPTIG